MDRRLIGLGFLTCVLGSLAVVAGQSPGPSATPPDPNSVRLVGGRFKPLSYAEMAGSQKKMFENLLTGERRGASGPFNVLLRSPETGDLVQQVGASVRYHSSLPPKLNEMAILVTARHWTSQYEWYAHKRAALAAGLSASIIDAIAAGTRPAGMSAEEEAIYTFASELLTTKQVGDKTFQAMKDRFGERGVVDLIAVSGYYQLVSMLLNVDGYPLPNGVQPDLKPLR